jgi:transposase-like protein
MSQHCLICRHDRADEIDAALRAGTSIRVTASKFGVSRSGTSRHALHHLVGAPPPGENGSGEPADPLTHTAETLAPEDDHTEQPAEAASPHRGKGWQGRGLRRNGLTPQQVLALDALMAGRGIRDVAKKLGLGESTVHRWFTQDEGFRREYQRLTEAILRKIEKRLDLVADAALVVVHKKLVHKEDLDAARIALQTFAKLRAPVLSEATEPPAAPLFVFPPGTNFLKMLGPGGPLNPPPIDVTPEPMPPDVSIAASIAPGVAAWLAQEAEGALVGLNPESTSQAEPESPAEPTEPTPEPPINVVHHEFPGSWATRPKQPRSPSGFDDD